MVRFIFICMAVVAVAIMTTAAQFMISGIEGAKQTVTARNAADAENTAQMHAALPAADDAQFITPESLNALETAAGADTFGDGELTGGFSNTAPKGLEDTPAPVLPDASIDSAAQ
jgi:hypothetical protein